MAFFGIAGGGITGLTLALNLQRKGHRVLVWEQSDQAGGAIRSHREGGWLAESGPNSIQDSDESVSQVVGAVGLSDRMLEASTQAKRRYIVRGSRPVRVPESALDAVRTPLFSWGAKLGVAAEPFRSRPEDTPEDESLASFVRRRLGQEFLDYTINPMVGGIYAGNPEKLSVGHAFPKVKALEDEFGSLIRGAVGRMRERRKSGRKAYKKRVLSFPDGLGELTGALAGRLGTSLQLNTGVLSVNRTAEGGYSIETRTGKTCVVDRFIYAGTAHGLEKIHFSGFTGDPAGIASKITYAPVHSVTLGFSREQVEHPVDGFGVLVPEVEPIRILGCLFPSSIFPGRSPENGVTLTVFIGGMRRPELTKLDDDDLMRVIRGDLRTLLGVTGDPAFTRTHRWAKAIPQYEVGYGDILSYMDEIERGNPGFEYAGNYKTGISLDACIRYGWSYNPDD